MPKNNDETVPLAAIKPKVKSKAHPGKQSSQKGVSAGGENVPGALNTPPVTKQSL